MLSDSSSTSKEGSAPSDLLAAALEYEKRHWSIIPTVKKKSSGGWKQRQSEPADEAMLRRMFGRKGITGVAVILGPVSGGLACRDFDDASAYHRWAARHPDAAAVLPTVRTGRGYHVYFRGPTGFHDLGDGEYRADSKHYCLLPPSRHPSGAVYSWLVPLPAWALPQIDPIRAGLVKQIQRTQVKQATQGDTQDTHNTHCMSKQEELSRAIAVTLPTRQGQRNRMLFDFASRLKAIMPGAAIADVKPIVRNWFDFALPVIGTKDWSVTWEDFITAWRAVKYPIGGNFDKIVQTADSLAVDTRGHDGAPAAIIRLCAALQAYHGDGVQFPLSCERAGTSVGVSKPRAGKILNMLVFEGIIERAKEGGAKGSGQAAEYRFCQVQK